MILNRCAVRSTPQSLTPERRYLPVRIYIIKRLVYSAISILFEPLLKRQLIRRGRPGPTSLPFLLEEFGRNVGGLGGRWQPGRWFAQPCLLLLLLLLLLLRRRRRRLLSLLWLLLLWLLLLLQRLLLFLLLVVVLLRL